MYNQVELGVNSRFDSGQFYFSSLSRGVEFASQQAGMPLLSVHPDSKHTALQKGVQYLQERRLDALVLPYSQRMWQSLEEYDDHSELPIVLVNVQQPMNRASVVFDLDRAIDLIIGHLSELGHREVLWLGRHTNSQWDRSHRQTTF